MVRRTVFDDIELEYRGKSYTIKANAVLRALASVEDIIAFNELIDRLQKGKAPQVKIAQAYSALLQHAGASVTDDLVYYELFPDGENAEHLMAAVQTLVAMFVPPDKMDKMMGESKPKPTPTLEEVLNRSSVEHSKHSLSMGTSGQPNSGN